MFIKSPNNFRLGFVLLFILYLLSSRSVLAVTTVSEPGGFAPLSELGVVFGNLLGSIATLAGFVAVTYIIVGAFRYITSAGDPKAVAGARSTLTWAFVGLAFVIISFFIIDFIAGFVAIPAVGRFCLPSPGAPCPP